MIFSRFWRPIYMRYTIAPSTQRLEEHRVKRLKPGLGQTCHRASRIIPYDREFIVYTLPTTRTGTAKVDSTRGIKLNYLYYWCQGFDNPNVQTHWVDVRYDPFDASRAYAFVNGQWLDCWSEYRHAFQGRSEREIILATQELRKQSRNQRQCSPVTAKRLAELLATAEGQEAFLAQRLKDQEVRKDCSAASAVPMAISSQSGTMPHLHKVEDEPPESRGSPIPASQRIYQEF
jgi:putative transposase